MKKHYKSSIRLALTTALVLIALLGIAVMPAFAVTVAPTVTTQAVSNISYTSATFNGNITVTGGENAKVRGFQWGTSTGVYGKRYGTRGSYGTGAYTYDITGLKAGTTYYCRAYAVNSAGTGYGSEVSFTTTAYVAPTVATNAATNLGVTSATLNGAISATGGTNATAEGFDWGISSGVYTKSTIARRRLGISDFLRKISGLTADTTYYFRAKAYNGLDPITASLGYEAGGTAVWAGVNALITAPTSSDYARCQVDYATDFGDFTDLSLPSFTYKISGAAVKTTEDIGGTWPIYVKDGETVTQGYLSPYFVIKISKGQVDHYIISQPWASTSRGGRTIWSNSQASNIYTEALWHDEAFTDPDPPVGGGVPTGWGPLSYFTDLYNDYTTATIKVAIGNFEVTGKQSVYTGSMAIVGQTVDFREVNSTITRWGYGVEDDFTTLSGS